MPPLTSPPFDAARALLLRHFGHPAFRPLQAKVVRSVLTGRDVLAVLPTGGGKSICFQIPALVLDGLTLVVSPLISLMQDQVDAALGRGLPAASLHSALPKRRQAEIMERVATGAVKLLYVSPERLTRLAPVLAERSVPIALLAVDEAHCIAEWGHDFRPSYRGLRKARQALGWPQAIALTGSATPEVRKDIIRTLGLGSGGSSGRPRYRSMHLGSFDRANLRFEVVQVKDNRDRLASLAGLLRGEDRVAIVYAPTRNMTEAVARVLRDSGYLAAAYHAGLEAEQRRRVLEAFLDDRLEVVVATCAFGMGIDKPNVRMVVHWTMAPTPESYYQEAGRAGRDGAPARCVLLYQPGDAALARRQLDVTFPPERLAEQVWGDSSKRRGVAANVLDAIDRLGGELKPERGPVDWRRPRERRKRAEARLTAMVRYAETQGCRRSKLLAYFGERSARCSGCDRCGLGGEGDYPKPCAGEETPTVLLTRLREWRDRTARSVGRSSRELMSEEVLRRVASRAPRDRRELAGVDGVGPRLLVKFGSEILRALAGRNRSR